MLQIIVNDKVNDSIKPLIGLTSDSFMIVRKGEGDRGSETPATFCGVPSRTVTPVAVCVRA